MGGENIHSVMSTVTDAKGAQIASMYWEEPAEKTEDIVVEE
jgi:hypothetical protein